MLKIEPTELADRWGTWILIPRFLCQKLLPRFPDILVLAPSSCFGSGHEFSTGTFVLFAVCFFASFCPECRDSMCLGPRTLLCYPSLSRNSVSWCHTGGSCRIAGSEDDKQVLPTPQHQKHITSVTPPPASKMAPSNLVLRLNCCLLTGCDHLTLDVTSEFIVSGAWAMLWFCFIFISPWFLLDSCLGFQLFLSCFLHCPNLNYLAFSSTNILASSFIFSIYLYNF